MINGHSACAGALGEIDLCVGKLLSQIGQTSLANTMYNIIMTQDILELRIRIIKTFAVGGNIACEIPQFMIATQSIKW